MPALVPWALPWPSRSALDMLVDFRPIEQRRLADRVMRANAQGKPRMDSVTYLSSSLEVPASWSPRARCSYWRKRRRRGWRVKRRRDMKRLMPDEDTGQGIGEEYEEALRLRQELASLVACVLCRIRSFVAGNPMAGSCLVAHL